MMERYKSGMDQIQADAELKKNIIHSVRRAKLQSKVSFFNSKKKFIYLALVCTLFLISSLGIALLQQKQTIFDGFVITAYASDGTQVQVKPDVKFPLGTYSRLMSQVPGFPIKLTSEGADVITLKASEGAFISWSPQSPKVVNKGLDIKIQSGETIYWSPLTGEQNLEAAAQSTLEVKAYKNKKEVGSQTIAISSDDRGAYTGKLVHKLK